MNSLVKIEREGQEKGGRRTERDSLLSCPVLGCSVLSSSLLSSPDLALVLSSLFFSFGAAADWAVG